MNAEHAEEPFDFKQAIVAILVDGERRGTGFFVSEHLVVTCAHVIDDRAEFAPTSPKVRVRLASNRQEFPGRIIEWRPADQEDIALLEVQGAGDGLPFPGNVFLRLRELGSERDVACCSFGYVKVKDFAGLPARGTVLEPVQTDGGLDFLCVKSKQLTLGYSGAPLVDPRSGRVLGVVSSIVAPGVEHLAERHKETAFAIPAGTLRQIRKELFVEPPRLEDEHLKSLEKLQQGAAAELKRSEGATRLLARKISERFDDSTALDTKDEKRPEVVTRVLFNSPLNDVLDIVLEAYHELGATVERRSDSTVAAVVRFGSHLFPAIYDEHQLRDIRAGIESGQPFLVLPSTTMTIVEILMAGVDGRRAIFASPFSKDNLPGGELLIQDPPESGLLEAEFSREFETALFEKLEIPSGFRNARMINVAIQERLKTNRRYYFIFPAAPETQIDAHRGQVVEQLKRSYPGVVFLKQCCPADGVKEFLLLYRLQEMFTATIGEER